MRILATPTGLLLALAVLATPAVRAQTASSLPINTGTVQTTVYNNGNIGGDCSGAMPAFVFSGDEGSCGAGFLLGLSATNVIGDAYILNQTTGWTPVSIGASTAFPYPTLNQGVRAVFTNAANGVSVELNAYYATASPDFVVFHYAITNTGSSALANVYPGLFFDYDVGGAVYAQNLAAVSAADNLLYVWDPTNTSTNYFGGAALSAPLTGWRHDTPYPSAAGVPHARGDLWTGLSQQQGASSTARDQRSVIGTGPFTIAAGATHTAVFTMVAGTNQADLIANTQAAQAAVTTPSGPTVHDTGVVQLEILEDGFIGADLGVGVGFPFAGQPGATLFEGQAIIAVPGQVSGSPYCSEPSLPPCEWATTQAPAATAPLPGFNQAFQTVFTDAPSVSPIGVEVTQRTYSNTGSPYVFVEYRVRNTTAAALNTVYVGLFTDWDVSAAATADRAGYDAATRTAYTFNNTAGGNQNYYGVTVLASNAAGVSGYGFDVTTAESSLFNALTTTQAPPAANADRRQLIGSGPYAIPAGGTAVVRFAIVAGPNLAGLIANAGLAQAQFPVSNEPGPVATDVRLSPARPNPATASAAFTFTLPESQHVTLGVYDALGRRVDTLVDGLAAAGEHAVEWDASALPTGVYILRLVAGSAQVTQRVSVVR